jgi:hypothetical protein
MMETRPTRLREIIGAQLSAVSFVQDYVEFHFDGPVLRVFTRPAIATVDGKRRFPDAGSRDALCTAIRDIVREVEIREHEEIILHFASGRSIMVPIREDGFNLPEAFTFQTEPFHSKVLEVWNAE